MRSLDTDLLENRKKKILQIVIHQYISTANPVSSKFIADLGGLDLSPATIRNVLSNLEEDGYITHPHTSAGRVPTDKGYRYYVDSLIEIQRLARGEEDRISHEYDKRVSELRSVMQQTSKILSSLSNFSGFVLAPRIEKDSLEHLEIIKLGVKRILVVIISRSGMVRNKTLMLKEDIQQENLNRIAELLNKELSGVSLNKVKSEVVKRISEVEVEQKTLVTMAKSITQGAFDLDEDEFFLEGASNILSLPEFGDFKQLKMLFNLVEEKKLFSQIIEDELAQKNDVKIVQKVSPYRKRGNIKVVIGRESIHPELKEMSLISSIYQHEGNNIGVLGIIGPKRMEYSKMITLVDYISSVVGKIIEKA